MSNHENKSLTDSEKKKEDWMNTKWRPMMGWSYMATCITDFIVFPVLWSALQATLGREVTQWNPLTLQGAGLYHVAMGAVLGLTAWGRTQEKLNGANNGGLPPSNNVAFNNPTPSSGFSPAPTNTGFTPSTVESGFGGKPMPPQPPQPLL